MPRQAQRRLSAAEAVAVARAYQAGAEMHELAEQYGVHRTNISRCLHSMGVQVRRQGLESEQVLEAARLYCEGWSLARLGERFGCAHTTVRTALLETGVALRSRPGWSG